MSVNIYGSPAGVHIPVATDFRANQTASSRYRYRRVVPDGNQTSLTTQESATQDINFRFGSGYVLNLAKTRLRIFELWRNNASHTASTTTYIRALPPIRGIRLQTSAGVILFDIQNFDAFMNVVYPFTHKAKDIPKEAVTLGGEYFNAADTLDYSTGPYDGANSTSAPYYSSGIPMPGSVASQFLSLPRPKNACSVITMDGSVTAAAAYGGTTPGGPLLFPSKRNAYIPSLAGTGYAGTVGVAEVDGVGTVGVHPKLMDIGDLLIGHEVAPNAYISPIKVGQELIASDTSDTNVHQSYNAERGLPRQYVPLNDTAGSLQTLQWDMPLAKLLPHTICAALQDMYFGTDLMLTVTMASARSRSFQAGGQYGDGGNCMYPLNSNARTGPASTRRAYRHYGSSTASTGRLGEAVAPAETDVDTAAAAKVSVYTVQDMQLATQENLDLVNSVKSEIASKGMRLPVQQPFMAIESMSAFASATQYYTRTIRANVARGASILRFYTGFLLSCTAANGTLPFKRLCANPQDGVWHAYRANLNAVPVADSIIAPWDQWVRQQEVCDGSLLQSYRHWAQASGIVVEDYTSGFDLSKTTPEGGLPLANPIEIQIDWQCARSCTAETVENVFIGVMLKYLSISPAGVTLESV